MMSGKTYGDGVRDLYFVLDRAVSTFQPATTLRWLVGPDHFLEARRPIDVLAAEGPERVIAAIAAHDAGAYP